MLGNDLNHFASSEAVETIRTAKNETVDHTTQSHINSLSDAGYPS
jgi:hypothetical protein